MGTSYDDVNVVQKRRDVQNIQSQLIQFEVYFRCVVGFPIKRKTFLIYTGHSRKKKVGLEDYLENNRKLLFMKARSWFKLGFSDHAIISLGLKTSRLTLDKTGLKKFVSSYRLQSFFMVKISSDFQMGYPCRVFFSSVTLVNEFFYTF